MSLFSKLRGVTGTAASSRKKYQKATGRQLVEIGRLLESVCRKEGLYAIYDNGWDDHRVAAQVGVSGHSVAHLRKDMFGILKDPSHHFGRHGKPVIEQEPAKIQTNGMLPSKFVHERFERCEEELAQLRLEINRLKKELGVAW